jgi:predicted ATPase/DNA-binding CsgD family transcriptional regulator
VGEVTSQAVLFQQVEEFVLELAGQRPVILLLDDLHWADPASLELLRFLARGLVTLPLLVLVTYRSDELTRHHTLYPLLPILVREASAARLDLGRLEDAAVSALVAERYDLPDGDAARLTAYLQGRAEGNALFLGELLRALEEVGTLRRDGDGWRLDSLTQVAVPPLLRQVIDGRIARLGGESQRLLTVAAVTGQEVPLAVLGPLADLDGEALLGITERATEAYLLTETPDGLQVRFAHALIREAVYEGVSPARRRLLHRRIAELLAAQPQPDPDAVAMHWAQYHRQAGNVAAARAHAERARAHATEPRQPLALLAAHRLLGALETDAGRYDDAARHLAASLALADACRAPYERALTLLARAELRAAEGDRDEAGTLLGAVRAIGAPLGAQPALLRADTLAASLAPVAPPPAYPDGMTEREVEVLRHIAAGGSNRAIAERLSLSVRTVERHIENLYRKIGARSKAEATAYAFRHRLA